MLVDDLVVCGAEPLFLTDYIATGRVVPERIAAIVKGIAEACVEAGCALIGGETAEHPGLLEPDEYDVAGSTTGVVEADRLLGPGRVRPGDAVVAMASSGLHSNGYSLVRHVLLGEAGWSLDRHVDELGRTLGEELLEPTRIYAKACLALADGHRHPRDVPRHRRRPGRQPGPGACRSSSTPRSSAAPGPRGRSSTWCAASATYPRPTSSRRSTAASAWSRWSRPPTPAPRCALLGEHGVDAWVAGEVTGGRLRRGPADRPAPRLVSVAGRLVAQLPEWVCGNTRAAGSVGTTTNQTDQTGVTVRPTGDPAQCARGLTLWGAAERRLSRRRSHAT